MKTQQSTKFRYLVQIHFIGSNNHLMNVCDISEPVKTMKEASQYKSIVDDTVLFARIVDMVNNSIVVQWK